MIRRMWLLMLGMVSMISTAHTMIYDNRFWPLYPERFLSYQVHPYSRWYASARGIFIGADRAYLTDQDDDTDLFDMYGPYNEVMIDKALQAAHTTSGSLLLPDQQMLLDIPWSTPGKMSLRGCAIESEVYLTKHVSMGGSFFVGHMLAHNNNILREQATGATSPGNRSALIAANTSMITLLGLQDPCYSSLVFGDIDFYIKGRVTQDYWYTLHHIDVSGRFGIFAPSGSRASLTSPVSFPVGGNGHLGIYGQIDCMIELKDLLSAGFSLQISKRLARTMQQRLPALKEPANYGALVLPTCTDPGVTIAFNPYVQVGGIRNGLGLMGAYYLVSHNADTVTVPQELFLTYKPNISLAEERSEWGSDHFSASIWYDFGYESDSSWSKPLISLTVDIPWKGPVTKLVPKSHAISLRIEFDL